MNKAYDYKISAAGRVNLIGEHVDYCGGKVFPASLSMCNVVYVRPNGTDKINLAWTTLPDKVSLDIHQLEAYHGLKYGNYQAGCAYVLMEAGKRLVGCDMLQDCSVPFGSGLSSSAAIEVSTITALATVAGEKLSPVEIALLAQKAEREYVGMNCGIMDQYASACGKRGHAMLLDCKTLECDYVPLTLNEYTLVLIDCNKPHNLVESKYNERCEETGSALKKLQKYLPLTCLAELKREDLEAYRDCLLKVEYKRALHVVEECARVTLAKEKMQSGDLVGLGQLLNASHASLKDLYEVTGKELDALASIAQSHGACLGSRMTGGGFGGCTVSIVKKSETENFKKYVCDNYEKATGLTAKCYLAEIEDGLCIKRLINES